MILLIPKCNIPFSPFHMFSLLFLCLWILSIFGGCEMSCFHKTQKNCTLFLTLASKGNLLFFTWQWSDELGKKPHSDTTVFLKPYSRR